MNTNQDWKLVPIEPTAEMWAAVNKLDDQMAAGGYDGKGASIEQAWNCLVETAPAAPPLTVVLDPDPRGVSVGVYQGSRCVYNGAHPIPAGATGEDGEKEYGSPARILRQFLSADGFIAECDIPEICARLRPAAPAAGDALPTIKGASITGGYVVVTTRGWDADRAVKVRDAILRLFPVDPTFTPKPEDAIAQQKGEA